MNFWSGIRVAVLIVFAGFLGTTDATAQSLQALGQICIGTNPNAAIAACTKILQSGSADRMMLSDTYFNRAKRYIDIDDYASAISDLNRVLQYNSNDAEAYHLRGLANVLAGNNAAAVPDLKKAAQLDPSNKSFQAWYHKQQGVLYISQNQHAAAVQELKTALTYDRKDSYIWKNLGNSQYTLNDYSSALQSYTEGKKLDPKDWYLITGQADAYYKLKDYKSAITAYTEASKLKETGPLYHFRGLAYAELKDQVRAVADYEKAVKLDPKDAWTHNSLCWARAILNQLERALPSCNEALRLVPDYAGAFDSRGLVYLKQGRHQDSWNDYNRSDNLEPGNAYHLFGRGIAALRLGRTADGEADIAKAKSIAAGVEADYISYGINPPDTSNKAPAKPGVQALPAQPAAGTASNLETMGAGELFVYADEMDQKGSKDEARNARRALIRRFPDTPLAATAAQQLAAPR